MKQIIFFILFSFILFLPVTILAVEVAPRISDREIIEKLAGLEAGQKALRSEMKSGQDALRSEMKSGQDALRSEMKAGQDALRSEMKSGQDALRSEMKSGLEALGKRMDDMNATMLTLFSTMVALILALFAYIAWDRRTMLKPVVDQLDSLERDVIKDLDLRHTKGSLLSRQLKALRGYAHDDPKLTKILRGLSLL